MAYNLQSLIHAIHQIQQSHQLFLSVDHSTGVINEIQHPHPFRYAGQLEYLLERVTNLQQILENIPLPIYKTLKALQIDVIHESQAAEDIVDSVILMMSSTLRQTQITMGGRQRQTQVTLRGGRQTQTSTLSRLWSYLDKKVKGSLLQRELQKAIRKFDSLIIRALMQVNYPAPASSSSMLSFVPDQETRDTVVGLNEDIRLLQDRLTGYERELKFIPIVGMGGIGKTTLAKKLYVDPLIESHFDRVAWATVSQDYDVKAILSSLLSCSLINVPASNFLDKEVHDVGLALHQNLINIRYLIVLDDVWDTNVLDRIRTFFPGGNNHSRILLTTRELDVANYVNSSSPHHQMHLLDEAESWNMFQGELLHEGEGLDPQLAGFGRIIANGCKGLPLAITLIGGLLSGSNQTKAFWKHVADDISTTLSLVDERLSEIFSLSYDHLPHHLRPCLLYIGAFPSGTEVRVSRIKMLWAAENFLKPIENKTPEEAAEEYLEALANRNLLLVSKRKSNGKAKSYVIHDFVRDQCIRKAHEENFIVCVKYRNSLKGQSQGLRRVLVFNKESFFTDREGYQARDSEGLLHDNVRKLLSTSKLIKVLDAPTMYLPAFPRELLNLVNIRYLWLHCNSFPSPIKRLYNLETLIFCPGISIPIGSSSTSDRPRRNGIPDDFEIPSGLGKLEKLRHFKIIRVVGRSNFNDVMEKLQTLSGVQVEMETLIGKVPNIRKLALHDNSSFDLSSLDKLESLKISYVRMFSDAIRFTPSITKLTLFSCRLHDTLMKGISDLPCLQVLKLRSCYVYNHYAWDWVTREDGFPSLQFLEFDIKYLVQWITEDTHFPRLRHLVIRGCRNLEEVPSCIGDIPTLEIMEIDGCSADVVASARLIREEQCNVGNDSLQVRIRRRGGRWDVDDHP